MKNPEKEGFYRTNKGISQYFSGEWYKGNGKWMNGVTRYEQLDDTPLPAPTIEFKYPEKGQAIWVLFTSGDIFDADYSDKWKDEFNQGNVFLSLEEANYERDRRTIVTKFKNIVKQLNDREGWACDPYDNSECKGVIVFNSKLNRVETDFIKTYIYVDPSLTFPQSVQHEIFEIFTQEELKMVLGVRS